MDLPALLRTPDDLARFVDHVGLTADDRHRIAVAHPALDEHADGLIGWWLHLAQDGPGHTVLPRGADGEVDQDALEAARPHLRAWLARASHASYDAAWLDEQRAIARQLARPPAERGAGPDGWRSLLPFFALVIEALPRIFDALPPAQLAPLGDAWRRAMQLHLTAWVVAAP